MPISQGIAMLPDTEMPFDCMCSLPIFPLRSCLKFLAILKRWIRRDRFQDFVCPPGLITEAVCHNEQSGFAGHAQARGWLGMALDLLGALALHSVCTVFASLLWCYRKQAAPRPNSNRAGLVRLSVCTVFRVSNSVTNRSASRTQNQTEFELC